MLQDSYTDELAKLRRDIDMTRRMLFFEWERRYSGSCTQCPECLNFWFRKDNCERCGSVGWIPMVEVEPSPEYL